MSDHGSIIVDKKYEWLLEKYTWDCSSGYARHESEHRGKKLSLHRVIISLEENDPMFLFQSKIIIDHKNRNKLDCRYKNMRRACHALNRVNAKIDARNTSGYTGVHFDKGNNKWRVRYSDENKIRRSGGLFHCKHEAARKYNKVMIEIWGDEIFLNEIKEDN